MTIGKTDRTEGERERVRGILCIVFKIGSQSVKV